MGPQGERIIDYLVEYTEEALLTPSQQSVQARRLLLSLLKKHYGLDSLPEMNAGKDGKPFFPAFPHIHFSLSHCRRAVMAVVGDLPVGCDIEDIGNDSNMEILDVAFTDAERQHITTSANSIETLVRLWTRKEASVKLSGIIPDNPRDWPSAPTEEITLTTIGPLHGCFMTIAFTGS